MLSTSMMKNLRQETSTSSRNIIKSSSNLPSMVLIHHPCIPQALLNSSHMFHEAKTAFAHHGVLVDNLRVDWAAMQKQKDTAVSGLTKGIEGLLKKNKVCLGRQGGVCAACLRMASGEECRGIQTGLANSN